MRPPRKTGPRTKASNDSALKKFADMRKHPAADLGETDTSSSAEEGMAKDDPGFRTPAPDTDGTDYGLEFTDTGSRYLANVSKGHHSIAQASNIEQPNEISAITGEKPLKKAKKPLKQGEPGNVDQSKPTATKAISAHKRKIQNPKNSLKSNAKLMARTDLMIPRAAFGRIVREIMLSTNTDVKLITIKALEALHVASEAYVEGRFEDANLLALHARRVTLMAKDMELINFLRNKL